MRLLLLMLMVFIIGCDTEEPVTELLNEPPVSAAPMLQGNCPNFLWKNTYRMAVIPSGVFTMGNDVVILDHRGHKFQAYTTSFYIDKYEVSVSEFQFFVETSGYSMESRDFNVNGFDAYDPEEPAQVTWRDANAYARWVGKRLPTEMEWEKAARGGLAEMPFTWGDTPPTRGNYEKTLLPDGRWDNPIMASEGAFAIGVGGRHFNGEWLSGIPFNLGYSMRFQNVDSFERNGYGLFNMMGNVDEWVLDDWNTNAYLLFVLDPKIRKVESGSEWKVVRGGGQKHSLFIATQLHVVNNKTGAEINSKQHQFLKETIDVGERSRRHVSNHTYVGFRCAMDRPGYYYIDE